MSIHNLRIASYIACALMVVAACGDAGTTVDAGARDQAPEESSSSEGSDTPRSAASRSDTPQPDAPQDSSVAVTETAGAVGTTNSRFESSTKATLRGQTAQAGKAWRTGSADTRKPSRG